MSNLTPTPAFESVSHSGNNPTMRAQAQARARGFAKGWAHGSQSAKAAEEANNRALRTELEQSIQDSQRNTANALTALRSAIESTNATAVPAAQDVLDSVLLAAIDFAEAIIGHELETTTEPGRATLRRALLASTDVDVVAIRMNPRDASTLTAADQHDDIKVIPDANILPGDSVIEYPFGHIEHFLSAAVDRARGELLA